MYAATLVSLIATMIVLATLLWHVRRQRPIPGGRREFTAAPGYTVAERVALDGVTTEAVRLAVQMARIDDDIHAAELEAIRTFILTRIEPSDQAFAARVMEQALERPLAPSDQQLAIDTIKAVGSHRQYRTTVLLLVRVAAADGAIEPRERAFVEVVAVGLGVPREEVAEILASGRWDE